MQELSPRSSSSSFARHISSRVSSYGDPLPFEGEEIISRWGGAAILAASIREDGSGPKSGRGGSYSLEEVAQGTLALAVAQERLIGSFKEGASILGEIDASRLRRVLVFSWSYGDVSTVAIQTKRKVLGGTKAAGLDLSTIDPPVELKMLSAMPLNERWTSAMMPRSDFAGLAETIVEAASSYRMQGEVSSAEQARLVGVAQGDWSAKEDEQVAWLVDPEN